MHSLASLTLYRRSLGAHCCPSLGTCSCPALGTHACASLGACSRPSLGTHARASLGTYSCPALGTRARSSLLPPLRMCPCTALWASLGAASLHTARIFSILRTEDLDKLFLFWNSLLFLSGCCPFRILSRCLLCLQRFLRSLRWLCRCIFRWLCRDGRCFFHWLYRG